MFIGVIVLIIQLCDMYKNILQNKISYPVLLYYFKKYQKDHHLKKIF